MSAIPSHSRSVASGVLAAALLPLILAAPASAATPNRASSALEPYTSGGHILGFGAKGYSVSNGTYALSVEFVGAAPLEPVAEGSEGGTEGAAAALGRVSYAGLWKGISVTYDAPGAGIVRSTWHLEPGADPGAIRLRYNRPLRRNADGTLAVEAYATGALTESAPVAWQQREGERRPVDVSFAARGPHEVGFVVGAYDPSRPLVIDPTLLWNTFLGGSGGDGSSGIALDGSGNVYVVGNSGATWGSPRRAYTAGLDGFAAKLDASGTVVWNTFLGGSGLFDFGLGIALDGSGNVYVTGSSDAAWGNPLRAYTAGSDAYAAKLDASGALVWNTFLGGSSVDNGWGISLDGSGDVYVAGSSNAAWGSPVRPYTASADAFAAKLTASGALLWSTFLGGSGAEVGLALVVDGSGNAYVAGWSDATWGSPVRAHTADEDVLAAKLGASGALVWNTFLGGSGSDIGNGIAVDRSGNVYVAGSSDAAWGSPVRPYTALEDACAAKLDASGALLWNSFLGGSGDDDGRRIAVDGRGSVYVAGTSEGAWGSPVRPYTALEDACAARLDSTSGELVSNTFLGDSGRDTGSGIAVDASGNVYVAGGSNATWGSPMRPHTAGFDAFVARLRAADPSPPEGEWLATSALPGFRVKARIQSGSDLVAGSQVSECIGETLCVAGALPGRAEVFVRVVGPKPNGYFWPTIVKFSTSQIEIWIEQTATATIRYYKLAAVDPGETLLALDGLAHKLGFLPSGSESAIVEVSENPPEQDDLSFLFDEADPPPPGGDWLTTSALPGFRVKARIQSGNDPIAGTKVEECIGETLCVAGALAGRAEVFARVVGPKPNGYLWPTIVKFSTSQIEIWIEQTATGAVRYYELAAVAPGADLLRLDGLADKLGFSP